MGWLNRRAAAGHSRVGPGGDVADMPDPAYTPPLYETGHYQYLQIGYRNPPNIFALQDLDYIRPPAAPTFTRAWQGVQKPNAASELAAASVHLGMSPSIGSGLPRDDWEITVPVQGNFLQYRQPQGNGLVRRFADGASGVGTMGPGTPWAPNPTATGYTDGSSYANAAPPAQGGLFASIRHVLGI